MTLITQLCVSPHLPSDEEIYLLRDYRPTPGIYKLLPVGIRYSSSTCLPGKKIPVHRPQTPVACCAWLPSEGPSAARKIGTCSTSKGTWYAPVCPLHPLQNTAVLHVLCRLLETANPSRNKTSPAIKRTHFPPPPWG